MKMIFSVYNDQFPEKFSTDFAKKLRLTGIPKEYTAKFRNPGYDTIIKTALDFSEAAVIAHPEVKKTIQTYISKKEMPVMQHPESDEYIDSYDNFYNNILAK